MTTLLRSASSCKAGLDAPPRACTKLPEIQRTTITVTHRGPAFIASLVTFCIVRAVHRRPGPLEKWTLLAAQTAAVRCKRNRLGQRPLATRSPPYQMSRPFYWNCGVHTERGRLGDLWHVTGCNDPAVALCPVAKMSRPATNYLLRQPHQRIGRLFGYNAVPLLLEVTVLLSLQYLSMLAFCALYGECG